MSFPILLPLLLYLTAELIPSIISFTGSTRVGSIIAATCGKYIKPVTLELGGKAPSIVCEDADLDHAVNAIKFGAYFHSGQ